MADQTLSSDERDAKRRALTDYMQVIQSCDESREALDLATSELEAAQHKQDEAQKELAGWQGMIEEAVKALGADPLDYLHLFVTPNGFTPPDAGPLKELAKAARIANPTAKILHKVEDKLPPPTPTIGASLSGALPDVKVGSGPVPDVTITPESFVTAHGHQRVHKRGEVREKVLGALPATAHQVAERTGVKLPVVHATLADLQNAGLVVKAGREKGRGGMKRYIFDKREG